MEGERFQDIPASLAMSTQKLSEMKVEENPESSKTGQKSISAMSSSGTAAAYAAAEPEPEPASSTAAGSPPAATLAKKGRSSASKRGDSEDVKDIVDRPEINVQQYPIHDDLDIEIDKLVYVVEEHSHTLKKALVNRYMGMRKKWHDHEIQRIEDEKKIFEQELVSKQAELDREKYAHHLQKQSEAKAKRVTMKAIGLVFITNQRLKNLSTSAHFFKVWREIPKKRRMFMKSIDKIKAKFTHMIMRRHFQIWRKWTRENVRTRIQEVIYNKFENKFNDERLDLQGQIAACKDELEATQKQLASAMAAREKIEKDMKQSFMRGLCSLNIEAMSMMKKGSFTSLGQIMDNAAEEAAADQ